MREYKFRVWYPDPSRYMTDSFTFDSISWDQDFEAYGFSDDDNKVIMQCTGLKDKNGKGICEGDILGIGTGKWIVEFDSGSFTINLIEKDTFVSHVIGSVKDDMLVIGNIYENPELLENAKIDENKLK